MIRKTVRTDNVRYAAGLAVAAWLMLGASAAALAQASGMGMMDLEAARDSFFNSADRDGDFALSTDELMSAMGVAEGQLFDCEDSDGDGLCGYSEYLDSGQRLFQALDSDGDGWLSPSELQ